MKNYDEIANRVLERRDAYVARQKQKRQLVMKITSVACALVLVALVGVGVWQGAPADTAPMVDAPQTTTPTTAPTKDTGPGIGGDNKECTVHNMMYHALCGNFTAEQCDGFLDSLGENYDPEENNIVNFVRYAGITREEFIEYQVWDKDALDEIVWEHGNGCPYTKNQFLDAIYGDNPELSAWVFAPMSTWKLADTWSLSGDKDYLPEDWPPEGYGFGETRPTEE